MDERDNNNDAPEVSPAMEDEEFVNDEGEIIEFPGDVDEFERVPFPGVPHELGEIPPGHALIKPLLVLIAALILFVLLFAGLTCLSRGDVQDTPADPAGYRESGSIVYLNESMEGWYLDPDHQHFMDSEGKRYTLVDEHLREGSQVESHWRIME